MGLHKHAATLVAARMIWVATVLLLCTAVMGVATFEASRGMEESGRSWAGAIKSSFGRMRTALHSVSGREDAMSTAIQPSEGADGVCFEQDHAAPAGADFAEDSKSENGDTEDLRGQEDGERRIGLGPKVAAVTLAATAVGLAAAPVVIPAAVAAAGFGAGGIVAGSSAAGLMSSYGGTLAAGSVCATLQSIGAAGALAMSTTVATEAVAATLAATSAYIWKAKGAVAADEGCMHEDQVVEEAAPTCPLERDGDDGVEELRSPSASSMQH